MEEELEHSDGDLLKGLLEGDSEAAAILYDRHHRPLYAYVRSLVKARDGIHLLDADQQITTVRESSGEILGRHPTKPYSSLLTDPSDGDVYAVKPGGIVVCLREAP